jgi:hypothetical protein
MRENRMRDMWVGDEDDVCGNLARFLAKLGIWEAAS